jgi:hypothetical protein
MAPAPALFICPGCSALQAAARGLVQARLIRKWWAFQHMGKPTYPDTRMTHVTLLFHQTAAIPVWEWPLQALLSTDPHLPLFVGPLLHVLR